MLKSTIKLGVMPPLTGVAKIYGDDIARAAQIACREINDTGGVLGQPLEIIIEDDGSFAQTAVVAANKLIKDHGCCAIIGNLLSNARISVTYLVAEALKVPYLNFSFYEGSIASNYFFHFAALPNQQIDKMIFFMCDFYGSKMYFAGNNYEWPRGSIFAATQVLNEIGGESLGEEYFPIGVETKQVDELLDRVERSGAAVFVPYFAGEDQIKVLTRFAARGLKNKIALIAGHFDETMAQYLAPEVREGYYSCNTYFMSVNTEENKKYLSELAATPGVTGAWPHGNGTVSNFGEGTYLCVKAFAAAANMAGSLDPDALIKALEKVSIIGPQGRVQMDPVTHHARVNTYITRCKKDGTFEILKSFYDIEPKIPKKYHHLYTGAYRSLEDKMHLSVRMIEQLSSAVFLVSSSNGHVVYGNPAARNLFSLKDYNLDHINFSNMLGLSVMDFKKISDQLSREGRLAGHFKVSRDGNVVWYSIIGSIFTHPKYEETWILIVTDITEGVMSEEKILHYETQLSSTLRETIHAFALLVETRDPYTYGHMERVSRLAGEIAREMGLPEDEVRGIEFAAGIHDIGKNAIPSIILGAPRTLTPIEFKLVKTHSQVGCDVVKNIDFPWPIATMILQHHERLDGSGYPNGLKGEEILVETRILSVADVFDAVTTQRPYRSAFSFDEAFALLQEGAGDKFDPAVVAACVKVVSRRQ